MCFKFDYWPAAETLSCYLKRKREYTKSETVSCLAIGHFACHTLSFSGALCLLGWLGERMKERERAKRCVSDGKPPPLLLLLLLALMMDDEHTAIHWQKQCTTATATTAIISVQQTGQNVAVCVYLSPLPRIDTRIVFCATAALYFRGSHGVVFFILSGMLLCCRSHSHSWHCWILSPLLSNSLFSSVCYCCRLHPK